MADESGLTMEQRFGRIENEKRTLQLKEERPEQLREEIRTLENPVPKIQRVAHYLRDRQDFDKPYSPKLVSFGPIHHGEAKLQLGERYKLMWLAMYLNSTGQNARDLHKKIADNIKVLKDLFDKDLFDKNLFNKDELKNCKSQGFKDLDEKLSWMLFVDGCSLLQILDKGNLSKPLDYNKLNVKIDQLILVQQDMLLLENQLPYQVLRLLSCHVNADANLLESMDKFLQAHHLWPEPCGSSTDGKKENKDPKSEGRPSSQEESKVVVQPPPIHLLDHLRRTILGDCRAEKDRKPPRRLLHCLLRTILGERCREKNRKESKTLPWEITHRNIKELEASGIRLERSKSRRPNDIEFSAGKLTLPLIVVDDATAPTFLNLIAYEMCPDFHNDYGISSFVVFLDSLIDHPEDVKLLRKKGILRNALGSDEDVSKLFNTISIGLVTDSGSYSHVRKAIEEHYKNRWKTWMYQAWSTHFSSPWAIIGLLAAIVALVLTFIQTWYSVK